MAGRAEEKGHDETTYLSSACVICIGVRRFWDCYLCSGCDYSLEGGDYGASEGEDRTSQSIRGICIGPIPESVTSIKADQPRKFRGYTYTLRFNISREDLDLIIESRPFQRVWNVEYGDGNLSWYWEEQNVLGMRVPKYIESLPCYDYTREPRWFRPGQWDNPEAYAFSKEGNLVNTQRFDSDKSSSGPVNIQVLLYNEKEGEAYFITTRYSQ